MPREMHHTSDSITDGSAPAGDDRSSAACLFRRNTRNSTDRLGRDAADDANAAITMASAGKQNARRVEVKAALPRRTTVTFRRTSSSPYASPMSTSNRASLCVSFNADDAVFDRCVRKSGKWREKCVARPASPRLRPMSDVSTK